MKGRTRRGRAVQSPVVTRHVPDLTRLLLCVRAGGRCEFDGHNEYLFEHPMTLTHGNFAEIAHVVGFREDGPRGKDRRRPKDINEIDNLMLLCPACHTLIDRRPTEYTRAILERYKREHEDRIQHLTSLGSERKTSALVMKATISGQTVSVPFDHIVAASLPRYPLSRNPATIDLTAIDDSGPGFIDTACKTIGKTVARVLEADGEAMRAGHLSVFALGPIPLLVYLGSRLSTKVPVALFQRHREDETWTWRPRGRRLAYKTRLLKGGDKSKVALVLSLSGTISLRDLPAETQASSTVYEMTLDHLTPNPTFLQTRRDLDAFRVAYPEAIALIVKNHPGVTEIDLFPAVPAPIAVLCGRERLSKVHPQLRVFDNDKTKGGFVFQLTV